MRKFFFGLWLLFGALPAIHAVEPETCPLEPNPALMDAIVRKLESDGILDQAVERALQRLIKREREARSAEEAHRQAWLQEHAKAVRPVSASRDYIRGNPSAEVSLIEYSDFECSYCKRFHATPKLLLERFGPRVNWVLRHFPLPIHDPAARLEAIAVECAGRLGGNDAFWKYADAIFERTRSNGQGLPGEDPLMQLAGALGLDQGAFGRCLHDKEIAKRVEEDLLDGNAAGVSGTPTTLIRNNRTGNIERRIGAVQSESLSQSIERLLGEKR